MSERNDGRAWTVIEAGPFRIRSMADGDDSDEAFVVVHADRLHRAEAERDELRQQLLGAQRDNKLLAERFFVSRESEDENTRLLGLLRDLLAAIDYANECHGCIRLAEDPRYTDAIAAARAIVGDERALESDEREA